jgi:hypothetical protein
MNSRALLRRTQVFGPAQETRVENGGAYGQIALRQTDAFVHIAGGVPDLEAHVPKHVEHIFDHLFGPGGRFVGQQHHQVDVRTRGQRVAAIAADGDKREIFRSRRIGHRIGMLRGIAVKDADDLVLQTAKPAGAVKAASVLAQQIRNRLAAIDHRFLQRGKERIAGILRSRIAGVQGNGVTGCAQGFQVEYAFKLQVFRSLGHAVYSRLSVWYSPCCSAFSVKEPPLNASGECQP